MRMGAIHRLDRESRSRIRVGRLLRVAASGCAVILALLQISCVLLPVRVAPGVSGTVVDRESRQPVEGAIVVVRFDGHYDDILPDREVLGHREATTDARGHFSIGALIQPGLSAWPAFRTEARVVAVMSEGYRCARPQRFSDSREIRVGLQPALDENDRRDSCSPVPAERGEATAYMKVWRAMYPDWDEEPDVDEAYQLERLLSARSTFGFGENCEGPVLDLALAPDGRRAAFAIAGERGPEIHVVELLANRTRLAEVIPRDSLPSARRLAWTSPGDLVLWEPSEDSYQSVSPSVSSTGAFERIWSATGPASHSDDRAESRADDPAGSRDLRGEEAAAPVLAPEDLNDEGDARCCNSARTPRRVCRRTTSASTEKTRRATRSRFREKSAAREAASGGPSIGSRPTAARAWICDSSTAVVTCCRRISRRAPGRSSTPPIALRSVAPRAVCSRRNCGLRCAAIRASSRPRS